MTRLSSDSESTTTEDDLVTNGNILNDTNTQELERLLRQLRQSVQISAIETETEDQYTTSTEPPQPASINLNEDYDPEEEFELIPRQEATIEEVREQHQQVLENYNDHIEYQSSNEDEESSRYNNQETSLRPFEEAVYEFGLTSVRRVTADSVVHGEHYDLRPKFAILKHKTEHLTGNNQDARRTTERAYPKTPEWFFNIPDTRTPFTNFESRLSDDFE